VMTPTTYPPNAPMLRLVQPNIPQLVKQDASKQLNNYQRLWALSTTNADKVTMIVWPETAITLLNTTDMRRFQADLQAFLKPNQYLASGVLDADIDAAGQPKMFNRIGFYNNTGLPVGAYDKAHLVPFGEFLPFQSLWPFNPVASGALNFSAGAGAQIVSLPNLALNIAPNICYEVIFSANLTQSFWHKPKIPDLFLNVTNDGWYGPTHGPYQHVGIARMRGIEEGLPMARAANTGISAMFDPLGRKLADINLNTEGFVDVVVPQTQGRTIFAVLGNASFGLLWLLFAAWVVFSEHGLKIKLPKRQPK
jgi:apolipoprotein N-acyltransferase